MEVHFPDGVTLKKKEGTVISAQSLQFRLTTLISEKAIDSVQDRVAVFEGQNLGNGQAAVLKLRFQYMHILLVFLSHVLY